MKQELLKPVLDAGLYEYGYYTRPLAEIWEPYFSGKRSAKQLIVAYNNSDSTYASQKLFQDPEKHFCIGLRTVCQALDLHQAHVYLPEDSSEELLQKVERLLSDGEVSVTVTSGKVNVALEGAELIHHPDTLENIGRLLNGESAAQTVLVKAQGRSVTVTVPLEATVQAIIEASGLPCGDGYLLLGNVKLSRAKESGEEHLYGYGNSTVDILSGPVCVVEMARKLSAYASAHSCGKCTFCREGNYQLAAFLKKAVEGRGNEEDLKWMTQMVEAVGEESVCSFGKESVRFLADTFAENEDELKAHIFSKRCDSDVCQAFTEYAVDGALCSGCGCCRNVCKAGAIYGKAGYIHRIDPLECTKCGECMPVCPTEAIRKVRAGRLIGPFKLTKAGYFHTSRKTY